MADGSVNSRQARIFSTVRSILARRTTTSPVDGVQDDLREAGLTSLDLVNLMLAIEAEFDIEIPQADMTPDNFRTVEMIDALVAGLAPTA